MVKTRNHCDLIVIAGPTASGKSGFALKYANEYNGEIINADSMQIYRDNPILSAQPTIDDMAMIPHHLYGFHDGIDDFSVMAWQKKAQIIIQNILDRDKMPIICGGTGFYIKALLQGDIDEIPDIPDDLRQTIRTRLKIEGANLLWQDLKAIDEKMAMKLHPNDGQRIARALEVKMATGKSLLDWQGKTKNQPASYKSYNILLNPDRASLWQVQESRLDKMIDMGVLDEVRMIMNEHKNYNTPFLKTIGLREFIGYLKGQTDLKTAKEQAFIATRQYSKRQSTWFRHQFFPDKIIDKMT